MRKEFVFYNYDVHTYIQRVILEGVYFAINIETHLKKNSQEKFMSLESAATTADGGVSIFLVHVAAGA